MDEYRDAMEHLQHPSEARTVHQKDARNSLAMLGSTV